MFTGIVQGKAEVINIIGSDRLKTLEIQFPDKALETVNKGASIAINGTCLTVTKFNIDKSTAAFDVMFESLNLTNLGELEIGDIVNFERAAKIGTEIGGHLMSGHIICKVPTASVVSEEDTHTIEFSTPSHLQKYLLTKGFVGLNGCSLTLGEVNDKSFFVHLIPETLSVTTFGELKTGDEVNLEIDPQTQSIVDTVERIMEQKKPA